MSNDVNYWNGVTAAFHISGVVGLTIYSSSGTGLVDGNGQVRLFSLITHFLTVTFSSRTGMHLPLTQPTTGPP